ncbi:hypothetical protein TGAM01_v209667 [Trichoderma gamsii]|uniref:Transcription factor RfeG n=1 Tax=Trichoderma gamsii TaxID=398673 RepID=A0A2P4ZB34_9HYPO|nr:hypothetical protein TGAM01_v209667 [Trichoderma gamsii]PON21504.1 hypothetical protein TGAM01_v209667 [Trichoderma gamsii]
MSTTMSRPTTRMNEYFVPRDGIDREVISADICRYLGNDALVRPGHYENPQTGQPVQGYYITAYRNLTTAMIEDLKADSARWDRERRAQTARNSSGGISASRYANSGAPRPRSNSPPVQNYPNDAYAGGHPGSAVPPPQQPVYASNQPVPQGYPAPNYPYPNQAPAGGMAYATQPQDPFFGRGASPNKNHPKPSSSLNSLV